MSAKKGDGRRSNGSEPTGVGEDSQLVRGPATLLEAMRARASRDGVKVVEMWRRAAHAWLDNVPAAAIAKPNALAPRNPMDGQVLRRVVDYYHRTLLTSAAGLAYLEKRGLRDDEAIATHALGFADRTLMEGFGLSEQIRLGDEERARLQRLGVLTDVHGRELFGECVVVPILAADGEVQGLYGRRIFLPRKTSPRHVYLPGPRRGVWNANALHGVDEVVLCETLLDALTFWAGGFRNVTAAGGVEGFTEVHLEVLKSCGASRVLLAFDSDDAGERDARAVGRKLLAEGFDVGRVLFPSGLDANEYALKMKPAKQSLEMLLRRARPMRRPKRRKAVAD